MSNLSNYAKNAKRRAKALQQYRYQLVLEKKAREQRLYAIASEYRAELVELRERYNF
jgi:hypothetical protein